MVPPKLLEQLAMYFTALPCPPLAILLNGDETTSHDLLAGLIMLAISRNDKALNDVRKEKQTRLVDELLERGLGCLTLSEMYDNCRQFTGEYIHAFDDKGACTSGLLFVPMQDVTKGSKAHKAMCSWNAAQEIIYCKIEDRRNTSFFERMEWSEMMQCHMDRMQDPKKDAILFAPPVAAVEQEA
jgi:hypothetical protein